MSESKLIARLNHLPPDKLFQIPPEVLFRNMPSVPAEQLVVEVPPRADPDLPQPEIFVTAGALTTYNVPRTRASSWAVLAQGRAPIDRILGKFGKDLSNVRVTLEDLSQSGGGLPDVGPNRVVGPYFRVDVDNASPEDITVAHVTVFVERDWIRSNALHEWSIEFNRFDEGLNAWVSFPSKRVREEGGRAYYSVVVPGFSVIAVSGSDSLPQQVFKVTDLAVSPATPLDNEPFTVSVNVANTGASSAVFPASLWLNDTVEAATTVAIEAGATSRVEFSLSKPTGVYRLRVDRSVMNLIVGVPPLLPTPTPVSAAPPAEPTATPVPSGAPVPTSTPIPPVAPAPTVVPPVAEATVTPVPTSKPPPAPTATTTPRPPEEVATTTVAEADGGGPAIAAIILAVLASMGGIGLIVYMILVRRRMGRAF
jgi:PGF-pre-PGF domain-containing protein